MKENINNIPLKKFDQRDLINGINELNIPYLQLNATGVCMGLNTDYTRYHLNNPDGDYIAKLNNKYPSGNMVPSENFFRRIELYQRKLQEIDKNSSYHDNLDAGIFMVMNQLEKSFFVQISFNDPLHQLPGHVVVVRKVYDNEQRAVGYKLFDPLRGEYDCTTKENINLNREDLQSLIQELSVEYSRLKSIEVRDFEQTVKKLGIVKENLNEKWGDRKYGNMYDIFFAIERGDVSEVKKILAYDPTLANSRNKRKKTPLMCASDLEIASILLEHGADPHLQDDQKRSAMSNLTIFPLLKSRGINFELSNDKHSEIEAVANSLKIISTPDPYQAMMWAEKPCIMEELTEKDYGQLQSFFERQGPICTNKIIALISLGAKYDKSATEYSPEISQIIDKIRNELKVIDAVFSNQSSDVPLSEDVINLIKHYVVMAPFYMEGLVLLCQQPTQDVMIKLFCEALVEKSDFNSIASMIHNVDKTCLPNVLTSVMDKLFENPSLIGNRIKNFIQACKKTDLPVISSVMFSELVKKGKPGLIVNMAFPALTQGLSIEEKKDIAKNAIQFLQMPHLTEDIINTFAEEKIKDELRTFSMPNKKEAKQKSINAEEKTAKLFKPSHTEKKEPPSSRRNCIIS